MLHSSALAALPPSPLSRVTNNPASLYPWRLQLDIFHIKLLYPDLTLFLLSRKKKSDCQCEDCSHGNKAVAWPTDGSVCQFSTPDNEFQIFEKVNQRHKWFKSTYFFLPVCFLCAHLSVLKRAANHGKILFYLGNFFRTLIFYRKLIVKCVF